MSTTLLATRSKPLCCARCKGRLTLTCWENHMAVDLITAGKTRLRHRRPACTRSLRPRRNFRREWETIRTRSAGAGYRGLRWQFISTRPTRRSRRGDGVAMAWRRRRRLSPTWNLIQFHPTCLYHPAGHFFPDLEAIRGEGGILRNGQEAKTLFRRSTGEARFAPRDSRRPGDRCSR